VLGGSERLRQLGHRWEAIRGWLLQASLEDLIPPELGPAAEVLSELRDASATSSWSEPLSDSAQAAACLGRRAVLAQSWRDQPEIREPRRNLRPCIATPNQRARIEALLRNRSFVLEYADNYNSSDLARLGSAFAGTRVVRDRRHRTPRKNCTTRSTSSPARRAFLPWRPTPNMRSSYVASSWRSARF
jgi:hypothetical protein